MYIKYLYCLKSEWVELKPYKIEPIFSNLNGIFKASDVFYFEGCLIWKIYDGCAVFDLLQENKTLQPCSTCKRQCLMSDMVEDKSSDGALTLFCSSRCVIASKIQNVQTPGSAFSLSCEWHGLAHVEEIFGWVLFTLTQFLHKQPSSPQVFHCVATTATRLRHQPATWPWPTPLSETSAPFPVPWRLRYHSRSCLRPKSLNRPFIFKQSDASWSLLFFSVFVTAAVAHLILFFFFFFVAGEPEWRTGADGKFPTDSLWIPPRPRWPCLRLLLLQPHCITTSRSGKGMWFLFFIS